MSTNCIQCGTNKRTSFDLLCDSCRQLGKNPTPPQATEAPPAAGAGASAGDAAKVLKAVQLVIVWFRDGRRTWNQFRDVVAPAALEAEPLIQAALARHRPTPDTLAALRKAGEALEAIKDAWWHSTDNEANRRMITDCASRSKAALAAINAVLGQDGRVG